MAGKKNNGVVAVISDLTNEQAAQLTKEIIKAKERLRRKENQFYRMYKKDVIKYIKTRRRKSNEKNNAQLQETFKEKPNAGSYVLPDFRNRNFYKFCTG